MMTCRRLREQQVGQSHSIAIQNKRARFGQDNRANWCGRRRGEFLQRVSETRAYRAVDWPKPELNLPEFKPAWWRLSSVKLCPAADRGIRRGVGGALMREREKLAGGDLGIEGKRKSPPRTAAATKGGSRVRQTTPGSIGK